LMCPTKWTRQLNSSYVVQVRWCLV